MTVEIYDAGRILTRRFRAHCSCGQQSRRLTQTAVKHWALRHTYAHIGEQP